MVAMGGLPDPDWYFEHVLRDSEPGRFRPTEPSATETWQRWWAQQTADDALTSLAATQGWVVTTTQLREHGRADRDLRREMRRGTWCVPRRGTAAPVAVLDDDPFVTARRAHALDATAAALVRPGSVVSGRSAAILHGLPTLSVPPRPELTAQATLGRRARAHVRGATLAQVDVESWFGAPVTTVARTLVDLGRHDQLDAIMAADAALRSGLVHVREVRRVVRSCTGWPGVRDAREVLELASPSAESPLESLTRLRLHRAGFPRPQLQHRIAGYVVDLCWPQWRVVLECDGRGKYSADELWREKRRESRIRAAGWTVERVLWREVMQDWDVTCRRLAGLFPAGVVTLTGAK